MTHRDVKLHKSIVPLSMYNEYIKLKPLMKIFHLPEHSPQQSVAINIDTLMPVKRAKKRDGRPRYNWTKTAIELYSLIVIHKPSNDVYCNTALNWRNSDHINMIKSALTQKYLPKPEEWPPSAINYTPKW